MKISITLSAATIVAASFYIHEAEAHSWLDCVDWNPATNKCNGYARDWNLRKAEPFGQDVGRDIRPGAPVPQGLFCDQQKEPRRANPADSYTATYPMTRVGAGQTLTMRWPAKNHATVGTQRGVQIFISKTANGGDDFSHITSKEAWVQKYPKLEQTFSNCNPNVAGVDKAECTGRFEIPRDLGTGVYTLMWWWEFNAGEFYNSCADIQVTSIADGGQPTTDAPTPSPVPGAPTPPPTALENCPFTGTVSVQNQWNTGFIGAIDLTATEQISQWDLEVMFGNGEEITNMWNCRLNGEAGNGVVTVSNPIGYLSTLSPGQTVACGFQASKPAGSAPFGGAGAFVKVKGCEGDFQLPVTGTGEGGGNGGSNGQVQNSFKCNSKGTLNLIQPDQGKCMETCDCNGGYYGPFCEETTPQDYWEIVFTAPADSSLNFASSCDLQVSHRDLLGMALNIVAKKAVTVVMYDATISTISFRVYDDGAITEAELAELDEAIDFRKDLKFTRKTESTSSSGDAGIIVGLAVGGVASMGAAMTVYKVRSNSQSGNSRSSHHMAGGNIMAPDSHAMQLAPGPVRSFEKL